MADCSPPEGYELYLFRPSFPSKENSLVFSYQENPCFKQCKEVVPKRTNPFAFFSVQSFHSKYVVLMDAQ